MISFNFIKKTPNKAKKENKSVVTIDNHENQELKKEIGELKKEIVELKMKLIKQEYSNEYNNFSWK
jgi:ribosomal protein L29